MLFREQFSKVKSLILTIMFLALSLTAFAQTTLQIDVASFYGSPTTNRTISLQPMQNFPGNVQFVTSDSVFGTAYFSNAPNGLINGVIMAPPGRITFQVYIPAGTTGVIDATNCLATGTATVYPAGQVAWSIATSDQRYALSGTAGSNTYYLLSNPSNYYTGTQVTNAANSVGANGTNESLLIGLNATNNDTVGATKATNYTLTIGANATNNDTVVSNGVITYAAAIGAGATNNGTVVSNGVVTYANSLSVAGTNNTGFASNALYNFTLTIGANGTNQDTLSANNATNFARNVVGAAATNNGTVVSNGAVSFAQILATSGTNESLLIGANGTNNGTVVSNGAIAFSLTIGAAATNNGTIVSNGAVSFALTIGATGTNNGSVVSNGAVAFALSLGSSATNNDSVVSNGVVTFASLLSQNGSNYSRAIIGLGATNNDTVVSNGVFSVLVTSNANTLITASNIAQVLVTLASSNLQFNATNMLAVERYYSFLNTNSVVAISGFGSPNVNTLYFTMNQNFYMAFNGAMYFYDGANWNIYTMAGGILYQLGGANPYGNSFTKVGGALPTGTSFLTNAPISANMLSTFSNIAQNVQLGGILTGAPTNAAFSSLGTNIIMSLAGTNGGGGTTNFLLGGVVGGYTTNNYFTLAATNIINSIAASYATNGAGATNVYIAPGAGIKVVTNTPSYWTISTVIYTGTTDPNGSVSAQKGSLYMRFDSNSNFLYSLVNTNGITGWQE